MPGPEAAQGVEEGLAPVGCVPWPPRILIQFQGELRPIEAYWSPAFYGWIDDSDGHTLRIIYNPVDEYQRAQPQAKPAQSPRTPRFAR